LSDDEKSSPVTQRPQRAPSLSDIEPEPRLSFTPETPEEREEYATAVARLPGLGLVLREIRETRMELRTYEERAIERDKSEQARADARHKDAANLASAFRSEATEVEQLRKQIQGWRRDIARAFERLDEHETRFDEHRRRLEALERERAGLATELPTVPSSLPPESDP